MGALHDVSVHSECVNDHRNSWPSIPNVCSIRKEPGRVCRPLPPYSLPAAYADQYR